jgi:hypothetical protein
MTRDPPPGLELTLAKEKAADFEWAFHRFIEIVGERSKPLPECDLILDTVVRSLGQMHDEQLVRMARRTREFNRAP